MAKLDVIDNALDFLQNAGENLAAFEANGIARDVKYALLHLAAGVALLLKQRLADDHWALVFADINKATKPAFDSGDFISVGLEDSPERVSSVCDVEISSAHRNSLRTLRKLRNKVEHFQFEVSKEEGLSIAAKVWSFIFDFVQDHLAANFGDGQREQWEALRREMLEIENFVRHRREETARLVDQKEGEGSTIVQCPLCLELTFYLGEEDRGCFFL